MDDFLYAYNRLSPVTLDGQENTAKPKLDRRQGVACEALLENILENDGNPVYVMAGNQTYTARTNADGWKTIELVAPVSLIDKEFSMALRMTLLELERRHQQGFCCMNSCSKHRRQPISLNILPMLISCL